MDKVLDMFSERLGCGRSLEDNEPKRLHSSVESIPEEPHEKEVDLRAIGLYICQELVKA